MCRIGIAEECYEGVSLISVIKKKNKKKNLFQSIMEGTRFLPKSTSNNVHFRTTKKTHKWTINKALENAAREKESRKREN